jgi:hypothetical protein
MNFRIFTIVIFAVIISVYGCNKVKYADTVAPLDINPPLVNTINATADTLNIYQNGIRQNNASNIYPDGATSYLYFINGTQSLSVKRAGTATTLFDKTFTISSGQFYSIFVTGTSSGDMFQTVDMIDTAETFLANDTTYTEGMVRFVNASINSGPLSVTVGAGDTVNIKNINYAGYTPFMPFDASHSQIVKVFVANNTTPTIIDTLTFETGLIYTLYTSGSLTGTGKQAFGLNLAVNPYIQSNQ